MAKEDIFIFFFLKKEGQNIEKGEKWKTLLEKLQISWSGFEHNITSIFFMVEKTNRFNVEPGDNFQKLRGVQDEGCELGVPLKSTKEKRWRLLDDETSLV